jgi:hypothetical protein
MPHCGSLDERRSFVCVPGRKLYLYFHCRLDNLLGAIYRLLHITIIRHHDILPSLSIRIHDADLRLQNETCLRVVEKRKILVLGMAGIGIIQSDSTEKGDLQQ